MKKLFLMAAFAAFSFAVNAQTASTTTNAKAEKKECTPSASCCAKKNAEAQGTASASTAPTTEAVKSVSKSKSQKAHCTAEEMKSCAKSCADKAKAEKVTQ